MKHLFLIAALLGAGPALAQQAPLPESAQQAQIVLLGEVHDNPHHHAKQAAYVSALSPQAVVFEMLTAQQAARITADNRRDQEGLADILNWAQSGWPDFAMYHPIFTASDAIIYGGAVPRDAARRAMKDGVADWFGPDAAAFGLTDPLPADQQQTREILQMEAHCNALPESLLPGMVELQRLRDANLARATLRALHETGGPVAVILGNGHARKDWGVPVFLRHLAPKTSVFVLGQTEEEATADPNYDLTLASQAIQRDDPCKAFR